MLTKLEVGGFYRKDTKTYPCQEGVKFNFDNAGGMIEIFYKAPTQKELDNIRNGCMKIGLLEKQGIIFVLFQFGSLEWMDVPYSPHLSNDFTFQELGENKGFGITIVLVEAHNGEIECLRYIGAPTKWSETFKKLTLEQKQKPFNADTYDKTLQSIYNNYTTKELLNYADVYKV